MHRLVDDLLLLSRLDDRRETCGGLVDLTEIAHAAVAAARLVDPMRTYECFPSKTPALIDGDEHQLRRVLDNLLANVTSHTPVGANATVRVHRTRKSTMQITDEGDAAS